MKNPMPEERNAARFIFEMSGTSVFIFIKLGHIDRN